MLGWDHAAGLVGSTGRRAAGAALAAWLGTAGGADGPEAALAHGGAAAAPGGAATQATAPGHVTFTRDIAPLLQTHCAACHQPGGIAQFSVLTWREVRPWARAIRQSVRTRSMPPWKPRPGYGGPFVAERRLSDAELDLIVRWVDGGAPEGDPADLPPRRRDPAAGWRLGTPDLVIEMPEPYLLGAGGEGDDILRKFAIPIPVAGTRYVKGLEFQPGNARVVHHANLKIDPTSASRRLDAEDPEPGYQGVTPFSARFPRGYFLGWTPGQARPLEAEGMAWRLDPGSDLLLELHLTPADEPQPVQSRIGFFFTDAAPTKNPFTIRLGKQDLVIPPGATDYRSVDRYVLPVDVEVHGVQPHAHYLAEDVRGYATLPDGTRRPLIRIDDWDFHWQDFYRYETPFVLPRGTELAMEFTYDNSVGNPDNRFAPPRPVRWGQDSSNEMGDLWIQVVPVRPADLDPLIRDRRPTELAEDIVGFEMELAADPDQVMMHDDVASLYLQFGRIDEAVGHYRESVRLRPESPAAAYNLGTALLQSGELDEAAAHLDRALRLDADYALAHNNLGAVRRLQGRLGDAARHFRRSLAIRPDDGETLYNLAGVLMMQGALDEAVTLYGRAIDAAPGAPEPAAELAWLLATHPDAARRDPARAVALAERAAALTDHAQPAVLDVLAAAYAAAGRLDRAVATAETALGLVSAGRGDVAAVIRERLRGYRRALEERTAPARREP